MENQQVEALLETAVKAALAGGKEILEVYKENKVVVDYKADDSPLTIADRRAHVAIHDGLLATELPLLSEEGREIGFEERSAWPYFWMVDPLDGTKEFIKRNGEFTVNIALIHQQKPVMGVIYVPVKDVLYIGAEGMGSYKVEAFASKVDEGLEAWKAEAITLPAEGLKEKFTIVASRSHMSDETKTFMQELEAEHGEVEVASMGSSLKLCLVAEGSADIYPRFAPTMEWDTAAGHGIALGAGKTVIDHATGEPMLYNKENLLNNWFIVK